MSLNWKEINLILEELKPEGMQIQKAAQSAYDVITLRLYGREGTKNLLVSLSPGACRLHETFRALPKSEKPLRFAEFLNARIVNGWIEEAVQLGGNRIVRFLVRRGGFHYRLYARLWSNAANLIVTDENGVILDAMRRLPRRGEVSGGRYAPEETLKDGEAKKEYAVREFEDIPGASFSEKADKFYEREGGALSLEALREEARRNFEGSIGRIRASLERLRAKEAEYAGAERLRCYGDLILANAGKVGSRDEWLEAEDFYAPGEEGKGFPLVRIRLDPPGLPAAAAQTYYGQYGKAKKGLEEVRAEIRRGGEELAALEEKLAALLSGADPLALRGILKTGGKAAPARREDEKRPGLSFRRGDWLIMVGRDANENDALLRRFVKGNDLWLHARDFPGAYVFIKSRAGKTVPLDILLDAGNLAIFYSKGRNNGEGDLFYTPVKYLRRVKTGPRGEGRRGLVLPTQEKNLHIKVDEARLRELESCKVERK